MAPTFGSFSTANTGATSTNVTTVTCPSGTQTDDLLLFFACNDATNTYASASAGLTEVWRPTTNQGDMASACWYRTATSADVAGSTTYSVTKSGTAGTNPKLLVCMRYTGVDVSQLPLAAGTASGNSRIADRWTYKQGPNTTTAANAACPAPLNPNNTIAATDLAVRCFLVGQDSASTGMTMSVAPASWTKRTDATTVTNLGSSAFNVGISVVDRLGVTDLSTMNANKIGMWDSYTIFLPAAPDPATGRFLPFFM